MQICSKTHINKWSVYDNMIFACVSQSTGRIMSGSCQLAISGWKLKMTMWLRPTTANQEPRESVSIHAMGQCVVSISDSISNFTKLKVSMSLVRKGPLSIYMELFTGGWNNLHNSVIEFSKAIKSTDQLISVTAHITGTYHFLVHVSSMQAALDPPTLAPPFPLCYMM